MLCHVPRRNRSHMSPRTFFFLVQICSSPLSCLGPLASMGLGVCSPLWSLAPGHQRQADKQKCSGVHEAFFSWAPLNLGGQNGAEMLTVVTLQWDIERVLGYGVSIDLHTLRLRLKHQVGFCTGFYLPEFLTGASHIQQLPGGEGGFLGGGRCPLPPISFLIAPISHALFHKLCLYDDICLCEITED